MTDNPNNLTCAGFQAHLPELIASGEDVTAHPHLQECELCRALLSPRTSCGSISSLQSGTKKTPLARSPRTGPKQLGLVRGACLAAASWCTGQAGLPDTTGGLPKRYKRP
jgi:hypothetical protein